MPEIEIGVVTHYFAKVSVAVFQITNGTLSIGDNVHIQGSATDCSMTVSSMQIEHQQVQQAKKGDSIGVKVDTKMHEHDKIFKVVA